MSVFRDAKVEKLEWQNASLKSELEYKERLLCDYREEITQLNNDILKKDSEIEQLKRTLDDVCARLVDALGCTEHGRYLSEYAERRLREAGVSFTRSTSE